MYQCYRWWLFLVRDSVRIIHYIRYFNSQDMLHDTHTLVNTNYVWDLRSCRIDCHRILIIFTFNSNLLPCVTLNLMQSNTRKILICRQVQTYWFTVGTYIFVSTATNRTEIPFFLLENSIYLLYGQMKRTGNEMYQKMKCTRKWYVLEMYWN